MDITDVFKKMERARVRRIPLTDANGCLVGINPPADVATKFGPTNMLEVEALIERISQPAFEVV